MNSSITPSSRGIRFPLRYSRKDKARVPVADGHGAEGCTAGMIAAAIHQRTRALEAARKAALLEELGDHRAANIERIAARVARRTMRSDALWARIFAGQVRDNDERLKAIDRASHDDLKRSFRAGIWSARWMRVQLLKFTPGLNVEARTRIDDVLRRIAIAHDALTPWGHTLAHRLD